VDANGILHVSAKDKATGKQQSIVIRASSGLTDDEIKRMVKDAELHATEDKKFHELVAARNQADNLIHAVTKSMKEAGDKVSAEERKTIEQAVESLKEAVKSDDKELIETKTQALTEASSKMAEHLYAQGQAPGQAHNQAGSSAEGADAQKKDESVVDAEFEEVKGDDKKE
jgi:molecular chaperone DnaK